MDLQHLRVRPGFRSGTLKHTHPHQVHPKNQKHAKNNNITLIHGDDFDQLALIPTDSVNEMFNDTNMAQSADAESHLTAAVHVSDLWRVSEELVPPYKDKKQKKKQKKTHIKLMHKRRAYMKIKSRKYWVEIAAKEFDSKNDPPILYHVRTHRI